MTLATQMSEQLITTLKGARPLGWGGSCWAPSWTEGQGDVRGRCHGGPLLGRTFVGLTAVLSLAAH